jgi:hypothetical protein
MLLNQRLTVAWLSTLLVLVLCLTPRFVSETRFFPHSDKLAHFAMFALYSYTWARAVGPSGLTRRHATAILALGLGLALATEVLQGLPVIHRDPDPLDALADAAGSLAGVALGAVAGRWGSAVEAA